MTHDLAETLNYDVARVVAVADFDSNRAAKGKQFIENYYTKEGQLLRDVVNRKKVLLQVGTQQRAMPQFRIAAELVRNGRIGKLETVKIGLPGDPSGPEVAEMPVPKNLNYNGWLGSTPEVYYTEM